MKTNLLVFLCAVLITSFIRAAAFPSNTKPESIDYGLKKKGEIKNDFSFSHKKTAPKVSAAPLEPLVHFLQKAITINEGDATLISESPYECIRYQDIVVTVKIDKAPSEPVTVVFGPKEYFEWSGYVPAEEGPTKDYMILPSQVVLQEGELTKDIVVRIFDDGSTEVEELLVLTFSLITNGDAYAENDSNEYTITIQDDDEDKGVESDILISENFNSGTLPTGWQLDSDPVEDASWQIKVFGDASDWDGKGLYLHHVSSIEFRVLVDQEVITQSFDASEYSELHLTFKQSLFLRNGEFPAYGYIQAWNGTEWKNVLLQTVSTPGYEYKPEEIHVQIPIEFANSDMKIRFRYTSYEYGHWGIDDVKLIGKKYTLPIAAEVSTTPGQQYFGPNATVYFFDPETNGILAKIKNLTSFDYGCTSVEVDRAGDGASEWLSGYSISDKTLRVIPSNPNPEGSYEITLYYTTAELGEFASNITSMGKSEGGIGVGDPSSSTAVPVTVAKYNDDYAFTATFSTGFSGFGLSDAPPSGSLPVKLLSFEGKNSNEGNMLNWVTTEEVNNDYFAVERSSDARKFKEISRVAGLTILSNSNNYHFTDTDFVMGKNYYRLKQVDKDGKYAYSKTIAISSDNIFGAKLYPNPVQATVTIELPNSGIKSVEVRIVNMLGIDVYKKQNVSLNGGKLSQDIGKLQSGLYRLVVSGAGNSYTFPIVKQ